MFENNKKTCLNKIDKSNKQSIDQDIKPLIDLINSLDDYYTTSSCSGRILLIEKKSDKKQDARFVFAEHKKANLQDIKKSLEKATQENQPAIGGRRERAGGTNKHNHDLWLRQESIILHVCCRNLESAKELLKTVRNIGIKRAGIIHIGKKIILEIIGTESMETIIARNGKLIISNDYLKTIIKEANKKLERNKKKITELKKEITTFLKR